MRPKGTGLARGRVEGRDLRDLENLLSQKKPESIRRNSTRSQDQSYEKRLKGGVVELGPISGFDILKDREQEECLHRDSPNRENRVVL
jgi:hypothetical protein